MPAMHDAPSLRMAENEGIKGMNLRSGAETPTCNAGKKKGGALT